MIFLLSDWDNYPDAIPDISTKNRSFVKYAAVLKAMGCENWHWPLALTNPELQGIDPHDPKLTEEEKVLVKKEIAANPVYFFREVFRVRGSDNYQPMDANRGVMAAIWLFYTCTDFALVMQRQRGKTSVAHGIEIDMLYTRTRNTTSFLYTKDPALKKAHIRDFKEHLAALPPYVCPILPTDADNTEMLECGTLGNVMYTGSGTPTREKAEKTGRGNPVRWSLGDEVPFAKNSRYAIPALYAATQTHRRLAKESGNIYCNAIFTTAGDLDDDDGKYCYNLIHNGIYYNERILFDCADRETLARVVAKGSKTLRPMVNVTLSYRQLGISEEEQLMIVANVGADNAATINKDYYNVWETGSAESPFSRKMLDVIHLSKREADYTQLTEDLYTVSWFIPMDQIDEVLRTREIIMTLDSSDAQGSDYNAMIFHDGRTMEVLGTCNVNEANLNKYSLWIANIMIEYPRILFLPERKSSAPTIIDTVAGMLIANGMNPFKRIFNRAVDDPSILPNQSLASIENYPYNEGEALYIKYKKTFGFMTTQGTRRTLYDTVLIEATNSCAHLINCQNLSSQLKGLIKKNGRVDHGTDGNDDSVVSWLLGHWFVRYGRNLSFYCLDSRKLMTMVTDNGSVLSDSELAERKQAVALTEEINYLKERLIAAPDAIQRRKYEMMLKVKVDQYNLLGGGVITMDSIMNAINEKRESSESLRQAVAQYRQERRGGI